MASARTDGSRSLPIVILIVLLVAAAVGGGLYLRAHPIAPSRQPGAPAPAVPSPSDAGVPDGEQTAQISEPALFATLKKPATAMERARVFLEQGSGAASSASEGGVRESLGTPDGVTSETTENVHVPGQRDAIRTLHYAGMTVAIYHVNGSEPKDIVTGVRVTSPGRPLLWGLRIGAGRQQVIDLLGAPTTRQAGKLTYSDEEGYNSVTFLLGSGDTVREVRWDYYID